MSGGQPAGGQFLVPGRPRGPAGRGLTPWTWP